MATSVATPLERHLGQIADVTEMTSSSSRRARTSITLQFDLDRDIDGAARDVQAAINAARADLPATLRSNPTYRKVNPADAPILILALTSDDPDARPDLRRRLHHRSSRSSRRCRASARSSRRQLAAGGAGRAESAARSFKYGIGLEDVRAALAAANANPPKGAIERRRPALPDLHQRPGAQRRRLPRR